MAQHQLHRVPLGVLIEPLDKLSKRPPPHSTMYARVGDGLTTMPMWSHRERVKNFVMFDVLCFDEKSSRSPADAPYW